MTLRERFHELSNWHNKITIASGLMKDILQDAQSDPLQTQGALLKAHEIFGKMESYALEADKVADVIKKDVYPRVDPDKTIEEAL